MGECLLLLLLQIIFKYLCAMSYIQKKLKYANGGSTKDPREEQFKKKAKAHTLKDFLIGIREGLKKTSPSTMPTKSTPAKTSSKINAETLKKYKNFLVGRPQYWAGKALLTPKMSTAATRPITPTDPWYQGPTTDASSGQEKLYKGPYTYKKGGIVQHD